MSPAASATAASRIAALRRYRPTQPPASAALAAVGPATWACGLTANRSRTNVPSHSDPGPSEIPSVDTRPERGGFAAGPRHPGHVVDLVLTLAGRRFDYTETGKHWNNTGGTKKRTTLGPPPAAGIGSNLVFW